MSGISTTLIRIFRAMKRLVIKERPFDDCLSVKGTQQCCSANPSKPLCEGTRLSERIVRSKRLRNRPGYDAAAAGAARYWTAGNDSAELVGRMSVPFTGIGSTVNGL